MGLDVTRGISPESARKLFKEGAIDKEEMEGLIEYYNKLLKVNDPNKSENPKNPKKSEINRAKYNKGGLSKPKMMKGGSYKGKTHMYVAGGMVRDTNIMKRK